MQCSINKKCATQINKCFFSIPSLHSTTSTGTVEAMKQVETQAPQQILSQTPMQENPAGTNGTKEPQRKCLMCLLPFDELSSIGTASAEELKRIVDNIYKIAKIEVRDSKDAPLLPLL